MWRYTFWIVLGGAAVLSVFMIPARSPDTIAATSAPPQQQAFAATQR